MKNFFISGIGTNVGKTVVSAILTEALNADYWKPVQTGCADGRDTDVVKSFISNSKSVFHNEVYCLKEALSPHLAAKKENVLISCDKINLPVTTNKLIIEGAGGPLAPLNEKDFVIDLAKKFEAPIILVVNNYLGCINHSLLCIDYLLSKDFKLHGLILNGNFDEEVEKSICNYKPVKVLAKIPFTFSPNIYFISQQAKQINVSLF